MFKRKRIILAFFSIVFLASFCLYFIYTETVSCAQNYKSFAALEDKVATIAKGFSGEYSYIIKDIEKPYCEISRNENKMFPAASVIKLPIAAVAFNAAKEGKVSLSQKFTITAKDITGGSGIIKTMQPPVVLTFQEIIETMIVNSDNTATNKIIDILGYKYLNRGFRELGLRRTVIKRKMMDFSNRKHGVENYTSVSDIVFLLEKIYKGKLIDKESSQMILSFLGKQKINDRIPRYLPKNVKVAHKTGLERGVVHDAGIIFSSRGDCVVCVFTKKVKDYSKAKKFIARLSLATYNNLREQ
ncbi:MAG: class A beta-lactamase-related serine hydrolase [Candidatus Omnitrophica bacterium]|jgi:beta-lactamase class A|nr:class A beta-lactamase-related serine hydrolase [Candidatus Omnitrophota bacterium]